MIESHIDLNKAFSHPPPPWPLTRTFLFSVSPYVAYQWSTVHYWWIITQSLVSLSKQHTFLCDLLLRSPSSLLQHRCCHTDSPRCFLMHSDTAAGNERSHYEAWIMEERYWISERGLLAIVCPSILCSSFSLVQCCFFCSIFSTSTM